jgi:hypothetical protein
MIPYKFSSIHPSELPFPYPTTFSTKHFDNSLLPDLVHALRPSAEVSSKRMYQNTAPTSPPIGNTVTAALGA